ncbi:zinc finger protein-like [Centroberyx affinis]|uniref:zinc finger protein-like n=1 Tax=Centroberyx affinis TaxID=166261 RepID=UPI003A5BD547
MIHENTADSETPESFNNMSKAEILRGIVTERLTAAAQEILAVVERTVAGYEEEASGFKQEIDRQRRQLDVLLQPRVKLEREDELRLPAVCKQEEEVGGGVEDSGSLGLFCPIKEEEGEDEECESAERPAPSPRRHQEDLDNQTPSSCQASSPRSSSSSGQTDGTKPKKPQTGEAQPHLAVRVCILANSQTSVLSRQVFKKCPVREVKCPCGLQEADFLDLLRSKFPWLAALNKPFDLFTTDKTRKLQPLKLNTLTPEEIHRSIKSTGKGNSALYIRLKTGEEPQVSKEKRHPLQRKDKATKDSPSTSTKAHASSQTKTSQRVESNGADVLPSNLTTQQQMKMEEADDGEEHRVSEPVSDFQALSSVRSAAESEGDATDKDEKQDDRDEASRSDDIRRPNDSVEDLKESEPELHSPNMSRERHVKHSCFRAKRRKLIQSSPETTIENSNPVLSCRVCGDLHRTTGMLMKHAWSHAMGSGCLCGVCGEHLESAEVLRGHLKNHQKTHDCPLCGKSYLSIEGINGHLASHTGQRPYKCDVCPKTFALKSTLRNHKKLHVVDKPHKCDFCHKAFAFKEQVNAHRRIHTRGNQFRCDVCGKSLCNLRSLSQHRLAHTGEKRHSCEVCGKRFMHLRTLKLHAKLHTDEDRIHVCDVCCEMFHTSNELKAHMRTHGEERPDPAGENSVEFTA